MNDVLPSSLREVETEIFLLLYDEGTTDGAKQYNETIRAPFVVARVAPKEMSNPLSPGRRIIGANVLFSKHCIRPRHILIVTPPNTTCNYNLRV